MYFSFFRKPNPPPPKIPQWVTVTVPIVFAVMIGLIALVYNTMAADVKEIKDNVKLVEEKKVDNTTLKLMLKNQKMMIEQQKDEADRQREEDAKKFDQIQETQTQTLKTIQVMQQRPPIAAPSGFKITGPAQTHEAAKALSFKDFKAYKNASKEDQEAFIETMPEVDWGRYKKWKK